MYQTRQRSPAGFIHRRRREIRDRIDWMWFGGVVRWLRKILGCEFGLEGVERAVQSLLETRQFR